MTRRFWTTFILVFTSPLWFTLVFGFVIIGTVITTIAFILAIGVMSFWSLPIGCSILMAWTSSFLHWSANTLKSYWAPYFASFFMNQEEPWTPSSSSSSFETLNTNSNSIRQRTSSYRGAHSVPISSPEGLIKGYTLNYPSRPLPFATDPLIRPVGLFPPLRSSTSWQQEKANENEEEKEKEMEMETVEEALLTPPFSTLTNSLKEALYRGYGAPLSMDEATFRLQLRQGLTHQCVLHTTPSLIPTTTTTTTTSTTHKKKSNPKSFVHADPNALPSFSLTLNSSDIYNSLIKKREVL